MAQITMTYQVEPTVKAVLRNGVLALTLTATTTYGKPERPVSVTKTDFPAELTNQIHALLLQAQEGKLDELTTSLKAAVNEAEAVAVRFGEVV